MGSKSKSYNQAYGAVASATSPYMNNGLVANNTAQSALGINGADAGNQAYNTYKNSTGFQNTYNTAMQGIEGGAATRGLLGSGSTLRALQDRGTQLGNENYNNWLQSVMSQGSQGLQGASTLANAGQVSKSNDGGQGILRAVGSIGGSLASGGLSNFWNGLSHA